MFEKSRKCKRVSLVARVLAGAIGVIGSTITSLAFQDSASQAWTATTQTAPTESEQGSPFVTTARDLNQHSQPNGSAAGTLVGRSPSSEEEPVRSHGARQITLQQVTQSADRAATPISRLAQLQVEAAKEHRMGVQADYFPKFGAAFANLHYTEFLGQFLTVRRAPRGNLLDVPIQILNQNQTFTALTFTQPITPIFQVRQAVRIARADERIAAAKANMSIAANRRDRNTKLEETYFKLLIAQRRLVSTESTQRVSDGGQTYAGASIEMVHAGGNEPQVMESRLARETEAAEVRELTVTLNRALGWPDDTELELNPPGPLIENISIDEVSDQFVAGNPAVVEAEQNVVKARAAAAISKLAYVPTVAAVSGYTFQNIIPAVPSNFGYGGVIASYTLFDFGKREHGVKEAHAQLEMAELALQMTKAKAAADVKKSFLELERSRQLSQVALKMGSSMATVMRASVAPETEVRAARAEVEAEMLEADLAHRQAYNRLMALIDVQP
jgi:outer membrane protein TolC